MTPTSVSTDEQNPGAAESLGARRLRCPCRAVPAEQARKTSSEERQRRRCRDGARQTRFIGKRGRSVVVATRGDESKVSIGGTQVEVPRVKGVGYRRHISGVGTVWTRPGESG